MVDYIHEVGDGRGRREFFVDGKKVEKVVFANVRLGVVEHIVDPVGACSECGKLKTDFVRGDVSVVHLLG